MFHDRAEITANSLMSLRDILDLSNSSAPSWLSVPTRWSSHDQPLLRLLNQYERELWFVTLSAMLIDVTLTVHGLQLGLRELNPVARAALDSVGVLGLYGLKAVALLLGAVCVFVIPKRYTPLVPLGLAIPSVLAVVINTTVISYVLL